MATTLANAGKHDTAIAKHEFVRTGPGPTFASSAGQDLAQDISGKFCWVPAMTSSSASRISGNIGQADPLKVGDPDRDKQASNIPIWD